MARFNLDAYETVEQRIRRFYTDHPDGRITTELVDHTGDIGKTRWVVKAHVFRDRTVTAPDGTGYAFEVDGSGGANSTSALENCETSAIGRALAQINYSGDKRATREEMAKVAAAQTDWLGLAGMADAEGCRQLWAQAREAGADTSVLDQIVQIGKGKSG